MKWNLKTMAERRHKELLGIVVSNKMDKSAVVQVTNRAAHPVYGKVMKRRKKYVAHDEKNTVKIGDKVQIQESKPISKTKRWRIVQVIKNE
jgi:small subunit ribosomal protein S17